MILKIGETEYKIRYGFNSFCDTDIMDRVGGIAKIFQANDIKDDNGVSSIGKFRELFCIVRDLIFIGMQKMNPVENVQTVGDLLDQYKDEAPEGEQRGLFTLFTALSEELMASGFLADILNPQTETPKKKKTKSMA